MMSVNQLRVYHLRFAQKYGCFFLATTPSPQPEMSGKKSTRTKGQLQFMLTCGWHSRLYTVPHKTTCEMDGHLDTIPPFCADRG